ncbi:MAG: gfo/Idh/MocA family oxidoreductase, partial [Akkermansiaceae bacterium]
ADVDSHSKTEALRLHYSELNDEGQFVKEDDWITTDDEPDHDGLCYREQEYFLKAILEDTDLGDHMDDAISSMRIVAAADESFRTGKTVEL